MRIFNEVKTIELTEVDYEKGYLKDDKLLIKHHEIIPFKKGRTAKEVAVDLEAQGVDIEIGYDERPYRILSQGELGGRDVEPIEAEPDTPAQEAYDEYEDIKVYVPYNEAELKEFADKKHYVDLKAELAKIKEDIEQETFGIIRTDYSDKKARAAEIINELRILEGKEPRGIL